MGKGVAIGIVEDIRRNALANLIMASTIHSGELRVIDTRSGSHKLSLRKLVRAGIRSARLTPDFAGLFQTLSIADAPHHPPPGRRPSHPIHAHRGAFRRNHSSPGIPPCGDDFDTGLRPTHAPFDRVLPAALAGSYLQ